MKKLKEWPELQEIKGLEKFQYSTTFPPKWFDLEKYKNITNKSSKAWNEAITARKFAKLKLKDDGPDNANWAALFMIAIHLTQDTLDELSKPYIEGNPRGTAILNMDAFDYASRLAKYLDIAPDIPLEEILDSSSLLTRAPPTGTSRTVAEQYDRVTNTTVWDIPSASEAPYFSSYETLAPVLLDITAPDDLIAESAVNFAKTLRERFGLSNLKQCIPEREFEKWIDQRLLAFIDLTIWFEAIDVKPAIHQIADVLFPDKVDIDISEFIRKTVRKNAQKLMSKDTIGALVAQSGANDWD